MGNYFFSIMRFNTELHMFFAPIPLIMYSYLGDHLNSPHKKS